MQKIMIGGGAVLLMLGTAHASEEARIDLSAVPAAVMATATKEASGFKASSANTEVEDGKKPYEIQGMAGGKSVEVDVMEDGTLDEVETVVEMSAVPEAVNKAIMAKMPNFKSSKVEESKRPDGMYYEIEGADGSDKMEVEIKADGSGMKTEKMDGAS